MPVDADPTPRLTSLARGAGCACKLSAGELDALLSAAQQHTSIPGPPDGVDLLAGVADGDDAAVWRAAPGRVMVATTDFFAPLVDDPVDWGRIAATNAASDVFAMGGRPLVALNLLGWPRDLPFDQARGVLDGAARVAAEGGWVVAGGHSIDAAEPLFGQAVVGEAAEDDLLTVAGALPGQALVLTKPIGTGVITTALKAAGADGEASPALRRAGEEAIASMVRTNAQAARAARAAGASAATDVTGFGLLGHLHRLLAASGLAGTLQVDAVPRLAGVDRLVADGVVPGGTRRNAAHATSFVDGEVDEATLLVLADAQTSGGLLVACPPSQAGRMVADLHADGHRAAVVGHLEHGRPGRVRLG